MTSRLKLETGSRDEDVRDDRPTGGFLHRTPREFKAHPFRNGEHVCAYPDDSCHATVFKDERAGHLAWHRRHAEWDEGWQDLVERQADVIERQEARIARLEAQNEFIAEAFGHALAPLVGEGEPS